jgi:hypothetical protein
MLQINAIRNNGLYQVQNNLTGASRQELPPAPLLLQSFNLKNNIISSVILHVPEEKNP